MVFIQGKEVVGIGRLLFDNFRSSRFMFRKQMNYINWSLHDIWLVNIIEINVVLSSAKNEK